MRKVIAALAVSAVISTLSACGGSHDTSSAPKSMLGNWHQTNSDDTNSYLVAAITGDGIQINVETRVRSSIYWLGSFNGDLDPSKPFKYTSLADSDGMAMAIFASQDKYKAFSYRDGVLSFQRTFAGSTSKIELQKDPATPDSALANDPYEDDGPDFDGHYHYPKPKKPKATVTVRVPANKQPVYKAPAPPKISTRKR